jgi:hypothetical protein
MEKEKMGDLLLKYKSDKNQGTVPNVYGNLDTWEVVETPEPFIGHTYGESYGDIFENYERDSSINLLEIGVQRGGSLLAWKDYFKNANIWGVDIVDVILPEYRREEFTYIISDIKTPSVKEKLKDVMFDIIIDDGSHLLSDVIFVVNNYLSKLNNKGVLIIEDCQSPEHWLDSIKNVVPEGYEVSVKDLRSGTNYDNYLIIITKYD